MKKEHYIKIWPEYFNAVLDGRKTFEVRNNDRGYCFGDVVILREWDACRDFLGMDLRQLGEPRGYSGRELRFKIGYVYPIPNTNDVVFSLLRED